MTTKVTASQLSKTKMGIWNFSNDWEIHSRGLKLLRGFPTRNGDELVYLSSPKDRVPVNMPPAVQLQIDDWFEDRFGVRFRQRSIFSTGSFEVACHYARDTGEVRELLPQADFCFCWSPLCADLYGAYEDSHPGESIQELMKRLEFRCDDLYSALLSKNEIMMVCGKVLATPFNSASA